MTNSREKDYFPQTSKCQNSKFVLFYFVCFNSDEK